MLQSCRCRWHWPPIPHRVPPATFILNQGSGYATRSPLRKRINSQPARAPPPRSNNTNRIGLNIPAGTSILTADDARRLAQQCISQNPLYGAVAQALAGHISNSLLYRAVVLVYLGLETRASNRDLFSPAVQRDIEGHLRCEFRRDGSPEAFANPVQYRHCLWTPPVMSDVVYCSCPQIGERTRLGG